MTEPRKADDDDDGGGGRRCISGSSGPEGTSHDQVERGNTTIRIDHSAKTSRRSMTPNSIPSNSTQSKDLSSSLSKSSNNTRFTHSSRFNSISSTKPIVIANTSDSKPRPPSLSPQSDQRIRQQRLLKNFNSTNDDDDDDDDDGYNQLLDSDHFHHLTSGVVNSRHGAVLSRGSLLKTDHWASGRAKELTHHLQGAPNFRSSAYNIFGTAQPTVSGIKTVLGILRSNPIGRCKSVWFCTREEPVIYLSSRPFVLRDSMRPHQASSTISDRAENIEAIENRLKLDILKESNKYGGLILVHDETVEGEILPTWITADDVKTAREVWEEIKNEGYHVDYHRVPIANDQAPEDSYLDKYLTILRTIPITTSLIFNCGMGVIRTTFAMSAAIIMRRRQVLKEGGEDLFGIEKSKSSQFFGRYQLNQPQHQQQQNNESSENLQISNKNNETNVSGNVGSPSGNSFRAIRALRMVGEQQVRTRSLLKLMQLLQRCLPTANQHTVMELLTTQPTLLENLRKGVSGEFDIIMSLVSILDRGDKEKDLVDMVVDNCDEVVNLRDDILEHRIQFALTANPTDQQSALTKNRMNLDPQSYHQSNQINKNRLQNPNFNGNHDGFGNNNGNHPDSNLFESEKKDHHLRCALASLERYFFLIAFSGYCNEPPMSFKENFSTWLKGRSEISNMILRLRKTARQFIFAPLHDLTLLFRGNVGKIVSTAEMRIKFEDLERAGGEVVGFEWAHHIVDTRRGITLRSGLILKNDQWPAQFDRDDRMIRGALNFRKVPDSDLFGLSQPTQDGIDRVINHIINNLDHGHSDRSSGNLKKRFTWINLREEPLIYINGIPYVLRLEAVGLRNMKSYAGISSARLELLEDRLKSDILAELRSFDGRILLHNETDDGSIIGVWESATPESVQTLKEIMDQKSRSVTEEGLCKLDFRRQPITAEKAPDFEDVKDLIEIVSEVEPDSPFIVNCQLGRGRSTLTMVCILLIQKWLSHGGGRFAFAEIEQGSKWGSNNRNRWSYQTINNLIRVMRNGGGIKAAVDGTIEKCSAVYDLIGSIEVCRVAAEESGEGSISREQQTKKGLSNLRRYAFVLIFACYLNETKADTWRELKESKSFESFWKKHQVFKTILDELNGGDIQALTPLEQQVGNLSLSQHGIDWTEEEKVVVANRSGIILSAQTILKSDFFVGLQKMTLPMRIDGLPNIRQVPLILDSSSDSNRQSIFGSGMPTVDGLRRGLEKMKSKGENSRMVYWTSMREEPVLYVRGRPHVLRLFDQPLENVVTTGVAAAAVEGMELALKTDVLNELKHCDGRLLLHDEVEENGKFIVTAVWEDPKEEEIMTPREVFDLMKSEGFRVDYARLPVTDEQAPIPGVFSRLEERVTNALKLNEDREVDDDESEGAHLVFNCQMGRGRTTTGMVAAMLVANVLGWKRRKNSNRLSVSSIVSEELDQVGSTQVSSIANVVGGDTWDVTEANPYLEGEYKIILQLVSVLQHGRVAKKLTDKAIDAMDSVQNLRKAIYDFKLRAEAATPGSEKRSKILTAATNYLYRYGYLITFSNWLLERSEKIERRESKESFETGTENDKRDSQDLSSKIESFPKWLKKHGEIQHILQKRSLE